MAHAQNSLTWRFARTATTPGRYADGGGLYLLIRKRGDRVERLWLFRWRSGPRDAQRDRTMSLGPVDAVSLAEAREIAQQCRRALARGEDPRQVRGPTAQRPTFGQAADAFVDRLSTGLKSAKHAAQWRSTLGEAYCKRLRRIPVDEVTTDDVLRVLTPIWTTTPETARRIRSRIERVLDAAAIEGHRDGANPARWRGHLALTLPKAPALSRGHHKALPWRELPAFLERLRSRGSMSALALEWTILTAARTGETIGATWAEIDRGERLWTIPGARMKARREHRVPLGPRALEILDELEPLGAAHLFPGRSLAHPLSNMAMAELLKHLAPGVTVHGFRSTFRDWVADATTAAGEVAEAALAHTIGSKVERAYRRGDLLERRRELMAAWERFALGEGSATVTPLRRPAGA
jgi:integrase